MKAKEMLESIRHWDMDMEGWLDTKDAQQGISDEQLKGLAERKAKCLRAIAALPQNDHRTLLLARYFSHRKWESIAKLMHYEVRYVYSLHAKALDELDRIMEEQDAEKT